MHPGQYRVEASGDGWQYESPVFDVTVFEYPKLRRADAHLNYPQYTQLADKHIQDTLRVTAVEGTRVTWRCLLNKPVRSARLVSKSGLEIPLSATTADGAWVEGKIELDQNERFEIELIDEKGRLNQFPEQFVCKVIRNQPPKIEVVQGGDASVSPLQEFDVAANVQDDFGIQQAGLTFTFAEQPAKEIVLLQSAKRREKRPVRASDPIRRA